jgi:hypothetical protein
MMMMMVVMNLEILSMVTTEQLIDNTAYSFQLVTVSSACLNIVMLVLLQIWSYSDTQYNVRGPKSAVAESRQRLGPEYAVICENDSPIAIDRYLLAF